MKIRTILKSYYSSDEVQTLAQQVIREVDSLEPTNEIVTLLTTNLGAAHDSLKLARGYSNLNSQTQQVADADEVRDLAFRAFFTYVEAWALRSGHEHREKAQEILVRLSKFDRKLAYLGYANQSAELVLLFDEMAIVAPELDAIGATAWLNDLKAAEEIFLTKQLGKLDEEMEKKVLTQTKEARENTLDQLIALVQTLNGLAIAGIESIQELNARIDQLIADVEGPARARKSRKNNSLPNNRPL